jgi:endonuclease YncB( thermonuclease family)
MFSGMRFCYPGLALLLLTALVPPATAREVLEGPIPATVIDVIDGDTITVRAQVWLGQVVETRVRLLGVDAPELRARCAGERLQAEAALDLVRRLSEGEAVRLRDVRFDKYGGRVLARVELPDGHDLSEALVGAHLARSYGGGQRNSWCSETPAR